MNNEDYRSERLVLAKRFAEEIALLIPDLLGVAVGGSLSSDAATYDQYSDIDLFCYLGRSETPRASDLCNVLGSRAQNWNDRANLVECRVFLGSFDTNIKFFTLDFMRAWIDMVPVLDDQFLEEVEAFQNYTVLFDSDGSFGDLLELSRANIFPHTALLSNLALERFGKAIGWAVMQGIHRKQRVTSALEIAAALNALVSLHYLMHGQYPPSLKWRTNKSTLSRVGRGEELHVVLSEWTSEPDPFEPVAALRWLNKMETLVAEDYSQAPWNLHTKRWWWGAYNPDL